jgi:adenine nucleotide transporter 17
VGASLAVAALAGAGNMLLTTPASVVTTQMQAQHKQRQAAAAAGLPAPEPEGALAVCRRVWAEGGAPAFWKGLLPSLILVANPAVQYMLFEALTARALRLQAARQGGGSGGAAQRLGSGSVFLLGAAAKVGATIVTYPLIVVKARLQAVNAATEAGMRYRGTWHAITTMARDEGAAGFFKGMGAKLLQTALGAALMLAIRERVYEGTRAAVAQLQRPAAVRGMQRVRVQVVR